MLKRTLDITVSFSALIVSAPVILGTAIVINKRLANLYFLNKRDQVKMKSHLRF